MSKKQTIPPVLRERVWLNFFKTVEGTCYCCNTSITQRTFQAGHIISEHCGGRTILQNLVPLCKSCNTSMGVMNLHVYKERYFNTEDEPGAVGQNFIHQLIYDIVQISKSQSDNITKLKALKDILDISINEKINELE